MASGTNIFVSGGTTMRQVVSGDIIEANDFNNMRSNVDALLGNARDVTLPNTNTNNFVGYGQGGAGVNSASSGGLIYANNVTGGFKRLQDDVQSLSVFLNRSLRSTTQVDVTSSTLITASAWNNLILDIRDIFNNRLNVPGSQTFTSNLGAIKQTAQWGQGTQGLRQTSTYTFANENACRAFFNAGGAIGLTASVSNLDIGNFSETVSHRSWQTLFRNAGPVFLRYNDVISSSGSNLGSGFYGITSGDPVIYRKSGEGSYSTNEWEIKVRVNSLTNPTVITLISEFNDDNIFAPSFGSSLYDDGGPPFTLTNWGRRASPFSLSGITLSVPTVAISGFSITA